MYDRVFNTIQLIGQTSGLNEQFRRGGGDVQNVHSVHVQLLYRLQIYKYIGDVSKNSTQVNFITLRTFLFLI